MIPAKVSTSQRLIEQQYRRIQQQVIGGAFSLFGVFWLGTVWYHGVEGWRWTEAAYMSVITLATVGFMEIHPLGDRGRLFTIVLILLGVVSIGYIVNRFTDALIQGYFQEGLRLRRLWRQMEALTGHYIICGFGRMGQQIAMEFAEEGVSFVVTDAETEPINRAQQMGFTAYQGDATLDETLLQLQIGEATCLIAALPSDAENLYTILSAKTLNPKVRTIARAQCRRSVGEVAAGGGRCSDFALYYGGQTDGGSSPAPPGDGFCGWDFVQRRSHLLHRRI